MKVKLEEFKESGRSNNWPNKAKNWLPTIDHPYDKATCDFVVTAPAHYEVVSNRLMTEEADQVL